jgi:leader peptidase (prepilin peptidase)/N-methyltransferase
VLIVIFILGLTVGSFLNVCIYRIPKKESIIWKPSFCPLCGKNIPWYLNIPLISFIILRGKCSFCKGKISWQYSMVELLTASCFSFLYWHLDLTAAFLIFALLTCFLIVISFIDINSKIIPNSVIICGLITAILTNLIFPLSSRTDLFIAGLAGGFFLWLVAILGKLIFHKPGMGGGDIKLAIMIGLFVGSEGLITSVAMAFLSGALFGTIGISLGKIGRMNQIPFAPFLAFGTLCHIILKLGESINFKFI